MTRPSPACIRTLQGDGAAASATAPAGRRARGDSEPPADVLVRWPELHSLPQLAASVRAGSAGGVHSLEHRRRQPRPLRRGPTPARRCRCYTSSVLGIDQGEFPQPRPPPAARLVSARYCGFGLHRVRGSLTFIGLRLDPVHRKRHPRSPAGDVGRSEQADRENRRSPFVKGEPNVSRVQGPQGFSTFGPTGHAGFPGVQTVFRLGALLVDRSGPPHRRSVTSNIAEGYRKRQYPAAFCSKLADADGETAETMVWLDYARDCGYSVPCGSSKN